MEMPMETTIKQEPVDDWQYPGLQQPDQLNIQEQYPSFVEEEALPEVKLEPGEIWRSPPLPGSSQTFPLGEGQPWSDPAGRCVAQTEVAWNADVQPGHAPFGMVDQLAVNMLQEQSEFPTQVQNQERTQGWAFPADPSQPLWKNHLQLARARVQQEPAWKQLFEIAQRNAMASQKVQGGDAAQFPPYQIKGIASKESVYQEGEDGETSYNGDLWQEDNQVGWPGQPMPVALYGENSPSGERPARPKKQAAGKGKRKGTRASSRLNQKSKTSKKGDSGTKQPKRVFPTLKCNYHKCRFTTKRKKKLIAHKEFHIPTEFPCKRCYFFAEDSKQLLIHTNWHRQTQGKRKTHECGKCGIRFRSALYLQSHRRLHHKDDKDYQMPQLRKLGCRRCTFVTPFYSSYKRHMKFHEGFENEEPLRIGGEGDDNSEPTMEDIDAMLGVDTKQVKKRRKKSQGKAEAGEKKRMVQPKMIFKCTQCDYSTFRKCHFKCHMYKHNDGKAFQCDQCNFSTAFPNSLRRHLKGHDKKNLMTAALVAALNPNRPENVPFIDTAQQMELIRKKQPAENRVVSGEVFRCSECDYVTDRKCHFKSHLQKHNKDKPYKCPVCDFATNFSKSLKRHLMIHTAEKPLKCPLCEYTTRESGSMKLHTFKHVKELAKGYVGVASVPGTENADQKNDTPVVNGHQDANTPTKSENPSNPFTPSESLMSLPGSDGFPQMSNLPGSEKLMHTPEERELIEAKWKSLTGHKLHTCPYCNYITASHSHLREHMGKHSTEKSFRCNFCDFATAFSSSLRRHMTQHETCDKCQSQRGDNSDLQSKCTECQVKAMKFLCDICGHVAKDATGARRHKLVHNTDRPHLCDICGYAGKDIAALKRHMTKHKSDRGEKQYQCEYCSFSTAWRRSLYSHIALHTGAKKYACTQCEYATIHLGSMRRHMKKHGIDPSSDQARHEMIVLDNPIPQFTPTPVRQVGSEKQASGEVVFPNMPKKNEDGEHLDEDSQGNMSATSQSLAEESESSHSTPEKSNLMDEKMQTNPSDEPFDLTVRRNVKGSPSQIGGIKTLQTPVDFKSKGLPGAEVKEENDQQEKCPDLSFDLSLTSSQLTAHKHHKLHAYASSDEDDDYTLSKPHQKDQAAKSASKEITEDVAYDLSKPQLTPFQALASDESSDESDSEGKNKEWGVKWST